MGKKVLFVSDATYSMEKNLVAVKESICPVSIAISALPADVSVGIMIYRDYTGNPLNSQGLPVLFSGFSKNTNELLSWTNDHFRMGPGTDFAEACRASLSEIIKLLDENTLVIHTGDSFPHTKDNSNAEHFRTEYHLLGNRMKWDSLVAQIDQSGAKFITLLNFHDDPMYRDMSDIAMTYWSIVGPVFKLRDDTIDEDMLKIAIRYIFGNDDKISVYSMPARYRKIEDNFYIECYKKYRNHIVKHDLECVPFFDNIWAQIPEYFANNADHAIQVFKNIFEEKQEKALTLIPALGKFWRYIQNYKKDMHLYQTQILPLRDVASNSASQEFKEWNKNSYDRNAEIIDSIELFISENQSDPEVYYIDEFETNYANLKQEVILTITRDFNKENVQAVMQLLRAIRKCKLSDLSRSYVSEDGQYIQSTKPRYFPAAINHPLSYIPYLMDGKTLAQSRGRTIFAMLILYSENVYLQDLAIKHLQTNAAQMECDVDQPSKWPVSDGYWFSTNIAMFYTKLQQNNPAVLNSAPLQIYMQYGPIGRCRANLETLVTVRFKKESRKSIRADDHVYCAACMNKTSITTAVRCYFGNEVEIWCGRCDFRAKFPDHKTSYPVEKDPKVPGENLSYMCTCKNCKADYAVLSIEHLGEGVSPKCHDCRGNSKSAGCKNIVCLACGSKRACQIYSSYDEIDRGGNRENVCRSCYEREKSNGNYEEHKIPLMELMKENRHLLTTWGFKEEAYVILSTFISMFKVFTGRSSEIEKITERSISGLSYRGREIINVEDVVKETHDLIYKVVRNEECSLCGDRVVPGNSQRACGHTNCGHKFCNDCFDGVYNQIKIGKIVTEPQLTCPMCRRFPVASNIMKYPNLRKLIKSRPEFLASNWYAWCVTCDKIKEHSPKSCGGDNLLGTVEDFECGDCKFFKEIKFVKDDNKFLQEYKYIPQCPQCGEKNIHHEACMHLDCHCGCSYCYACGEAHDPEDILDHMQEAHGSWYSAKICMICDEKFPTPEEGYRWGPGSIYEHVHNEHGGKWY